MTIASTDINQYAEKIRIRGLVQGVGFRPTVWQLAHQFSVHGEVRNDGSGVQIIACSRPQNIDRFIDKLNQQAPALARIDSIEREVITDVSTFDGFTIVQSVCSAVHTGMVADAATCKACLQDINDPENRRYGYAFTNCTHCGPRLSIVRQLPYDRAHTSMADFIQCKSCQQEYDSPDNRRFHAQPNACPDCGPKLWLADNTGQTIHREQVIQQLADYIQQGKIIAIKGIGGFQLACDAGNEHAVQQLRQRKNRPHKALALMASTQQQISQYCRMSPAEADLLESSTAPIVLLDKITAATKLADSIAPAQNTLGFMLPNSPLHHLLMAQLEVPIVLTSGNVYNQPQCIDNQQALDQLGHIADVFMMHDRDIVNRIDDSVTRVIDSDIHCYRRARGYAPAPIQLAEDFSGVNILACGSEMKNTFCLIRDGLATLSQHIGNLDNAQTYDDYLYNLALYQRLHQFTPQAIAVDLHPEYQSSKYGRQLAAELQIPLIEVQHHHAHISACLADNHWQPEQGKVIGIALDGLGFGSDNTIWGGEFLLADYQGFERGARIKPTAMPGGNQASLEPWRNTFAHLATHADWPQIATQFTDLAFIQQLKDKPLTTIEQMMSRGLNSPLSSSCGRLFDAVAFTLGICPERQSYEGQAAIELEALLDQHNWQDVEAYSFTIERNDLLEINPAPMWSSLLNDLQAGAEPSLIAARFHLGLAQVITRVATQLSADSGISSIALSGGVFQNKSLLQACQRLLQQQSFEVLIQHQVPANDGGLSLGQAAIAAASSVNLANEK